MTSTTVHGADEWERGVILVDHYPCCWTWLHPPQTRLQTVTFKSLASLLSDKLVQPCSRTLGFLLYKIAFSLLDSVIMCLRGAWSSFHSPAHNNTNLQDQPLDLIAREARLSDWLYTSYITYSLFPLLSNCHHHYTYYASCIIVTWPHVAFSH